ncbi:MAG TPA: penicillin-binding protein 1A [Rhodospirillales bacterium]|nr:penicillin-binding protein 1A [Rhodospirillales bacterium]
MTALGSALMLVLVIVVAGAAIFFFRFSRDLPDIQQLATYEPPVTTRVYAGDGRLLAEYAAEKRVFVPISSMPPRLVQAFLSAEDKNFYQHQGIDTAGGVRAIVTNINNLGSDRRLVGASTIPQQVAKNFLLSSDVTMERKVKEAILAFRMDKALSKDRILELYLNEIYLGSGSYGVAAAALNYFDKSLEDLTLAEAATLAALPKAPNNYDPIRQPAAAKARRDWVLGRMLEDAVITQAEADAARDAPLLTQRRQIAEPVHAEYFAEEVRRELVRRYGEVALYKGGLVVHATIDPRLQEIADASLRRGLEAFDRRHGWRGPIGRIERVADSKPVRLPGDWAEQLAAVSPPPGLGDWRLAVLLQVSDREAKIGFDDGQTGRIPAAELRWARQGKGVRTGDVIAVAAIGDGVWSPRQIPKVEGALVAIDPHTGRVLALSGGWDYRQSEFNRATQAMRQPGSTFKPVVYLCAMEAGYTPSSIIRDAPLTVSQGPGMPAWRPMNYSNRFYGPTTLRVGLEQSRNLVAARLAMEVGMDKVADCANRLGVFDDMPRYPAYSLGAGETTLLRLTNAYAMIVNGGRRLDASLIDRVQDRYGRIVYRHDQRACLGCQDVPWDNQPAPDPIDLRHGVTDPDSAYQVVSMMEGVVIRGTGQKAQIEGRPIAGKTGTSNDARDVWFVGFAPDLAAGVFIGYDDPASLGDHAAGGVIAAPIFADFMQEALKLSPAVPFRTPPGVRMVRVDSQTGRPARSNNPRVILEAFKPGTFPPTGADAARRSQSQVAGQEPRRGSGSGAAASPDIGTGGLY